MFAGADLVMISKLFAQCLESAGEKGIETLYCIKPFDKWKEQDNNYIEGPSTFKEYYDRTKYTNTKTAMVKYSGMSTIEEQKKYKKPVITTGGIAIADLKTGNTEILKEPDTPVYMNLNPSEGSVEWIPVRWTLEEWLKGSDNQDEYPYLMGWINSIKSAMFYTGKKNLKDK